MADRKFSKDHEWVEVSGGIGTVGITDYAQGQLGDVVFVELPTVGKKLAKGDNAAVVESVKAASEVYTPVTGDVTEVNQAIVDDPAKVNAEAEGGAWFFKLKLGNAAELGELMDRAGYDAFLKTL